MTYTLHHGDCLEVMAGMESESVHQRNPLLYPIYQAELWITSNIASSLGFSKELATAAAPPPCAAPSAPR